MPIKTPHTKAERQAVVKTEMHKFKAGDLHSGSKDGPVVHNPKQAIAISLSESGQSKDNPPMSKPNANYELDAHTKAFHGKSGEAIGKKGDTTPEYSEKIKGEGASSQPVAGHEGLKGNAVGMAEHHTGTGHGGAAHTFPGGSGAGGHSFGHPATLRRGAERLSGHSGAHRIGKK